LYPERIRDGVRARLVETDGENQKVSKPLYLKPDGSGLWAELPTDLRNINATLGSSIRGIIRCSDLHTRFLVWSSVELNLHFHLHLR
jgi:hypothetical protein